MPGGLADAGWRRRWQRRHARRSHTRYRSAGSRARCVGKGGARSVRFLQREELRGVRYLTASNAWLEQEIVNELPYLDYRGTLNWYAKHLLRLDDRDRALL